MMMVEERERERLLDNSDYMRLYAARLNDQSLGSSLGTGTRHQVSDPIWDE
jgi:hypothetical protein